MNAARLERRTIVVHTKLAGHIARVAAARAGENGVQIMTMGQLAARLAGGLLRPVDPEALRDALREALPTVAIGELEPIKNLPGMVRAAVNTLDKVWRAGIDLSAGEYPRLQALHVLEEDVLRQLPPSVKRPVELVELACKRIAYAKAVLGSVEIHGHSEMSPCWRPLLGKLAETVPVTWMAGHRHVPDWLCQIKVEVRAEITELSKPMLYSCANPQHEAVEAFRWMRALLASGTPPEEIAITAASPADFDDHILALSREANIPVHFVHGINAVTERYGQTAAALAETIVKGISQESVRRLFALLQVSSPALRDLPLEWMRILPADAPLTTVERWEQAFARRSPADWPDGIDRSAAVLEMLRLLAKGLQAADEIGEKLLSGIPRALWRRALDDGPAEALPVTLTRQHLDDGLEPASNVIWASAVSLASSPRAHVRLLALNAGRWPRHISEDRLIPDHVLPIDELDPLPVADGDKHDFATIIAMAKSATISYSRRDVEGRLLGRSPLISDFDEIYLGRARISEHAASEADRLQARPAEFRTMPVAISGVTCWRDWYRSEITAHDGLVGRTHPRLRKLFDGSLSATSLKLLLRDPIRFTWRYALGWKQPEEADEPLRVDGLAFGNLVHGLLRTAVDALEAAGGLVAASPAQIDDAVGRALESSVTEWENEQPVPPGVIWRNAIERMRQTSFAALRHPLQAFDGQKSWTEIPFGTGEDGGVRDLPWRPDRPVEIPRTGIRIQGHIDRLDLSADKTRARVLDYKTGKLNKDMAEVVIDGGGELQRCLYAFAVRTLLARKVEIEAALFYPGAPDGEQTLFPLGNLDTVLEKLAAAIALARETVVSGIAVPGIDADNRYNDFAFALPASPSYAAEAAARARTARPSRQHMGRAMSVLRDLAARTAALTAIDRSLLVEAGAGSGKTSVMAGRVAILFANGVEPKHIAAITFTEFAASELRLRIEAFATMLSKGEIPRDLEHLLPKGITLEQKTKVERACEALDQLACTTIHGFAQALLKPYPAEANIDPGAEIVDPAEADIAFEERYQAWLKQRLSGNGDDGIVEELILGDEAGGLKLVAEVAQFVRRNRDATPAAAVWPHDGVKKFAAAAVQFAKGLNGFDFREEQTEAACKSFIEHRKLLGGMALEQAKPSNHDLIAAINLPRHENCFRQDGIRRKLLTKGKWQAALAANRSQFYRDVPAGPFYGYNRPGAKASEAVIANWWRQGMMGGAKAHYDGIVAFSQTDFTEDLKKITVPVLVMHSEDDQIVPYVAAGPLSAKLLKNGTLKTYKDLPHGMPTTHAETVNAELLAFLKG